MSTDIDPAVPLRIMVRTYRTGSDGAAAPLRNWTRAVFRSDAGGSNTDATPSDATPSDATPSDAARSDAARSDGGRSDGGAIDGARSHGGGIDDAGSDILLPASFAIVPSGATRRESITLEVLADANGVLLRRRVSFRFLEGRNPSIPIYLSLRCAAAAAGCADARVPCTVQQVCEDRGQSCGNEGACVPVAVDLDRLDAAFPDATATTGCGGYHQPCCALGDGCSPSLTCVAGRCQRCTDPEEICCDATALKPDGTVCVPTSNPCQIAGVCRAGVCESTSDRADGTVCAPTSDPCKVAGVCRAGVCESTSDRADGTVCAPTENPCQNSGTCSGGRCGPITNKGDGTVCGGPDNPCRDYNRCVGGNCTTGGAVPDGRDIGGGNYCCGGAPTSRGDPNHCGVCGIRCATGSCVNYNGHYVCYCTTNAQCAPSICRTWTPGNNLCACQFNADCSGTTCVDDPGPNFCSY